MRIIKQNPNNVLPELVERDIDNNLIVVFMHSRFYVNIDMLAYAVEYDHEFTWRGIKIQDETAFRRWRVEEQKPISLLKFISNYWSDWALSNPTIYICESPQDINDLCNILNIEQEYIAFGLQSRYCEIKTGFGLSCPTATDPN